MLLRRITDHVKSQNWFAVGIDFVIVVVGVFIGIQVSNWNEQRASRVETDRMLMRVVPAVERFESRADNFKTYYATTKAYGEKALLGWVDENAMSDSAFVVAAYQASQIMGATYDNAIFAETIGAENIRNIGDPELRRRLQIYIASPSNVTRADDLDTPYRRNVRRVIPFAIQEEIRHECGDRRSDSVVGSVELPAACDLNFPAAAARAAADQLRAKSDLPDDLRWHMASTQSVLFDLDAELKENEILVASIKAYIK